METPGRNHWGVGFVSPEPSSPPHWIRYNKNGKLEILRKLTQKEQSEENTKIAQMIEDLRLNRREKSKKISELQHMTKSKVNDLINEKFSGTKFDKVKLLKYIEDLRTDNKISEETYNNFYSDYSTPCDKALNMCTGITDTFKKAICCGKKKVDGGRKKKTRKKRKKKKVKNKRLLKTIRKRNKLRLNVQRKNCSIKKQKVKKNKYLKKKKKIMRLTRKLCKAKREVKKLMNQIGILKVKNNKALY